MARISKKKVDTMVDRLVALEAEKKALNDEIEEIKKSLEDYMDEKGVEEVETSNYKVLWRMVVSSRFDTTAFKKDHSDMYKRYVKDVASMRLNHYEV